MDRSSMVIIKVLSKSDGLVVTNVGKVIDKLCSRSGYVISSHCIYSCNQWIFKMNFLS